MPSNHLIFCCLLLLLPSIFPSIRVFSNESALGIKWPKYQSFSFIISGHSNGGFSLSISPSSEHSRLASFRVERFDLLAVQGTLEFAFSGMFYAFFADSSLTFHLLLSCSIRTLTLSVLFFSERYPRFDTPGSSVRSAVWTPGLCRPRAVKAATCLQAQLCVCVPFLSQRNGWITQQVSIRCLKKMSAWSLFHRVK